jgi:uncharacterized FlaG/YvyC family protein
MSLDSGRGTIPAIVLDAVEEAAARAARLAAGQRELHFERDELTGRVGVQLRDLGTGQVIRTVRPSEALEMLAGGALDLKA